MKTARREQEIIALLESRGDISVAELSGLLGISESTLRKQLAVMQRNGMVIRTYGGVMSVNRVPDESFESKLHKNMAEKRKIAFPLTQRGQSDTIEQSADLHSEAVRKRQEASHGTGKNLRT